MRLKLGKGFSGEDDERLWLPLNGLRSLDPRTAEALSGYCKGPLLLDGLTRVDASTPTAFAAFAALEGRALCLLGVTALGTHDAMVTARARATVKGRLEPERRRRLSIRTLSALLRKSDVLLAPFDTVESISDPDGPAGDGCAAPA